MSLKEVDMYNGIDFTIEVDEETYSNIMSGKETSKH